MLAAGTVVGTCAALVLGHLIESLLFGVKASDPLTLAIAALALGIAATVAAFFPARRAACLDPMRALRDE